MHKLEVFFDYACPYCLRGHEYLKELAPKYPQIEIVWRPCESHPRPERYGVHSDLCIRGMFFAQEAGADLWEYHGRMYRAALKDRINVEDIYTLAESVKGFLNSGAFATALREGKYIKELAEANDYAYERSGVWAVPAYRMDGRRLDSVEDIGVTIKQLEAFIEVARN
jgi:Predicted dithiol-disulfide isomerase involved in polyketide biosynthesis